MSTMPVEWYKQNLINAKESTKRLIRERNAIDIKIRTLEEQNAFLQTQIEEAEKRGISAFDENKLLRTSKKLARAPNSLQRRL